MTASEARVLLTSVGSLVGRCILDVLRGRRDNLFIVGGDLNPTSPTPQECDAAIALPPSDHSEFVEAVEQACRDYRVELVIPCRDPDARFLAPANDDGSSPIRMAAPSSDLVAMTRDKWISHQWCANRGIPFAPSSCTDEPTAERSTRGLIETWGYPLIAKPRAGSGSLGVRILRHEGHMLATLAQPGYLIQPFLDPPDATYLDLDLTAGVPLFWEVPVVDTPGLNLVVGPEGDFEFVAVAVDHRMGRVESMRRVRDESLAALADESGRVFRDSGWLGPLNMALRRSDFGWHIIELNPRFTGGTSSRLLLGFDEVRWVLNRWLGWEAVPPWCGTPVDRVVRYLQDFPEREQR